MVRPKKGQKGHEEAVFRWHQTMLNKYGEEGLHKKMQACGRKGGMSSNKGGFCDRELARTAGSKGGKMSKRGSSVMKKFADKYEDIRKMYVNPAYSVTDISRELEVPYDSLRYWIKNNCDIEKIERGLAIEANRNKEDVCD